jgi:hypothetical protein
MQTALLEKPNSVVRANERDELKALAKDVKGVFKKNATKTRSETRGEKREREGERPTLAFRSFDEEKKHENEALALERGPFVCVLI